MKAFPCSTLHYPTGPIALRPGDVPGSSASEMSNGANPEEAEAFGWWQRKEGAPVYQGIDRGLQRVAETIQAEGPFDGAIGFSQGGAIAAMVAALLETGRRQSFEAAGAKESGKFLYPSCFVKRNQEPIQPPLKFAIIYSGFAAPFDLYSGFYEPKIKTPVLHFVGSLDTVLDEQRGKLLIGSCEKSEERTITHPGGHFVPSQKIWVETAVGFIKSCLDESGSKINEQEPGVEEMNLPF